MDDFQRLKVLLYQYILFKGDFYKQSAEEAFINLRSSKNVTSSDVLRFYSAQLKHEFFDDFQKEIADILSTFS